MNQSTDMKFREILSGITDLTDDVLELDARISERIKVSAVLIAYDHARQDPNAKLPSYLMAALEQLRRG